MNDRRVYIFFALACAITWLLGLPMALSFLRHEQPPSYAMGMVALGAFGPTIAALIVGGRREAFGRWRTHPVWIVIALFLPMAVHLPATLLEVALGGHPAHWFYPPNRPEYIAALVFFSLGEEPGWRGYAYPRVVRLHGAVVGNLMLGAVWALWHLMMMFTVDRGAPSPLTVGWFTAELALWSVVLAPVFEKGNRSMAVALAVHAGGHLDNVNRAPETEVRLRVLRFAVLAVAALIAVTFLRRGQARATQQFAG